MKAIAASIAGLIVGSVGLWLLTGRNQTGPLKNPLEKMSQTEKELPYLKYTFENLVKRKPVAGKIEIGPIIKEEEDFTAYFFYYQSEGRRISGQLNVPRDTDQGMRPVVVMARGYVDKEAYQTGIGTRNAAAYFAKAGYLTLAPDFSGYGESDPEDPKALGARLVKPVEILDLLASLESLPQADWNQVYLWGHSNGGQIMLSVAEILGQSTNLSEIGPTYPKVRGLSLWAPVSKPFPYSILFYTDEAEDQGKWLRGEIALFEAEYDVKDYSIDQYWEWIRIPILLHQGTADEAVPSRWSLQLSESLREKDKEIEYLVYQGADHDLSPAWATVVARDVAFYQELATL